MDSLSHVAMGAGLGAIALSHPELLTAGADVPADKAWIVFLACIIGAFFPDIDVILKLLGQSRFLAIHRAMSHSILVVALSALGLTILFVNILPVLVFWKLLVLMLLAVGTHVIMDIFNNYGTQVLWPFKKKWYALSYTNTADSIIHILYALGFIIYGALYFANSSDFDQMRKYGIVIFSIIAIAIVGYLISIFVLRKKLHQKLREKYVGNTIQKIVIVSRMLPQKFKYIVETPEKYFVGFIDGKNIEEHDQKIKDKRLSEQYYQIIKKDIAHKNFVSFSPVYYWHEENLKNGGVRIKYTDLRYLDEHKHYSFNLVFDFDKNMNYVKHIGWVFNQPALERKLVRRRIIARLRGKRNEQ